MNKLNLGCGNDYREGYINIDKQKNIKADIYVNFEEPDCLKEFDDNTVEEVLLIDVLEHINNLFPFMKELWRVCKYGARVIVAVPYWSHYQAVGDPTHVRSFHEITFAFFSKASYEKNRKLNTQMSQLDIGFDFKILKCTFIPTANYRNLPEEKLNELKDTQINVIEKLVVEMEVVK